MPNPNIPETPGSTTNSPFLVVADIARFVRSTIYHLDIPPGGMLHAVRITAHPSDLEFMNADIKFIVCDYTGHQTYARMHKPSRKLTPIYMHDLLIILPQPMANKNSVYPARLTWDSHQEFGIRSATSYHDVYG